MNEAVVPTCFDFSDLFVLRSFYLQRPIEVQVLLPAPRVMDSEASGNAPSMNFPISIQCAAQAAQVQGGY